MDMIGCMTPEAAAALRDVTHECQFEQTVKGRIKVRHDGQTIGYIILTCDGGYTLLLDGQPDGRGIKVLHGLG